MKTLEEHVIEHPKASIAYYYDNFVKPLDSRFKQSSLELNRTVICPLHDDTDPSMGVINHRHKKDVKIFNCFGCGARGTIVRLHQRVSRKYLKKILTDEESAEELCKILDIDKSEFNIIDEDIPQSYYMRNLASISSNEKRYTIREYQKDILTARKSRDLDTILSKLDSSNVKLIATRKQLYD